MCVVALGVGHHGGRRFVRIFLRGYLFVQLQYLDSKEEFLFYSGNRKDLKCVRGLWSVVRGPSSV